ncbi:hypothetical protein D3870_17775 [Noviherbaspirillum cavernae]|uniref:Uncharacterized protein n=1 Tax=Noviherbaspirillum cavernae TaxID=2320862 RepID=A0A418X540_9BURK|nr:hypothetical protein D3870_17775 [Noviherbaspirillum cavernae]
MPAVFRFLDANHSRSIGATGDWRIHDSTAGNFPVERHAQDYGPLQNLHGGRTACFIAMQRSMRCAPLA